MSLSFASAESSRVSSLLPSHIRDGQSPLIGFIEDYYKYLATEGLPSNVLSSITSYRDIDAVSDAYLSAIADEIAKTIPDSSVIDKKSLYRKIVAYYSTRGTEDSTVVFFRIFFNEIVNVSYPKEQIIRTSSAGHNVSSRDWKMQDGEFYQEFSYLVKTGVQFHEWEQLFSRIVHPAGLKLFAEIALYLSARTDVKSWLDTRSGAVWESIRLPGHSPTIQPGWLEDALRTLIFNLYAERTIEDDHVRAVYLMLEFISSYAVGGHERLIHENYENVKFFDTTEISVYQNMTPFSSDYIERGVMFTDLYSNVSCIVEYQAIPLEILDLTGLAHNRTFFAGDVSESSYFHSLTREASVVDVISSIEDIVVTPPEDEIDILLNFDESSNGAIETVSSSTWTTDVEIFYYGNSFGSDNMDSYANGSVTSLDSQSNWLDYLGTISSINNIPVTENLDSLTNGTVTSAGAYTISAWV